MRWLLSPRPLIFSARAFAEPAKQVLIDCDAIHAFPRRCLQYGVKHRGRHLVNRYSLPKTKPLKVVHKFWAYLRQCSVGDILHRTIETDKSHAQPLKRRENIVKGIHGDGCAVNEPYVRNITTKH